MFWEAVKPRDLEGIVAQDATHIIAGALYGLSEIEQELSGYIGGAFKVEIIHASNIDTCCGYMVITPEQVSGTSSLFLHRISKEHGLQKIGLINRKDALGIAVQELYQNRKPSSTLQRQLRDEITIHKDELFVQGLEDLFSDSGVLTSLNQKSEARVREIQKELRKQLILYEQALAERCYQEALKQEGLFKSSFFSIVPFTMVFWTLRRAIKNYYNATDFEPVLRKMSLNCLRNNIPVLNSDLSPSELKTALHAGYDSDQEYRTAVHETAHVYADILAVHHPHLEGYRRKLLSLYEREVFLSLNKR